MRVQCTLHSSVLLLIIDFIEKNKFWKIRQQLIKLGGTSICTCHLKLIASTLKCLCINTTWSQNIARRGIETKPAYLTIFVSLFFLCRHYAYNSEWAVCKKYVCLYMFSIAHPVPMSRKNLVLVNKCTYIAHTTHTTMFS